MALSALTIWEVRGGAGDDTNGGGFVEGASGTDYSQQDAKRTATGTNDSTTDAVANGTTTITSASANFTSAIVGNIIYLQGGSGSLAATRRQVTGFTDSTTITVDASVATGTGITMNIGGALASIGGLATPFVSGNRAFIKASATYTLTSNATFTAQRGCLIGYSAARTDYLDATITGRATITTATNSVNGITLSVSDPNGWQLHNLILSCTAGTKGDAFDHNGGSDYNCLFHKVKFDGWSKAVDSARSSGHLYYRCEIVNCTNTNGAVDLTNNASRENVFDSCFIHDNTGKGVRNQEPTAGLHFMNCWITDNGGDGIMVTSPSNQGAPVSLVNCVVANNGAHGLSLDGGSNCLNNVMLRNNIFYGNTSTGARFQNEPTQNSVIGAGNAYGSNGTDRDGIPTLPGDVALSADPFTNAAGGDYSLNNTAGGGADCRGAGFPVTIP